MTSLTLWIFFNIALTLSQQHETCIVVLQLTPDILIVKGKSPAVEELNIRTCPPCHTDTDSLQLFTEVEMNSGGYKYLHYSPTVR